MKELLAQALIRDIPDFPKSGILFKDITPVLSNPAAYQEIIDCLAEEASGAGPDLIVGIEARGFLFGAPLALALGLPFVPARKIGKLPSAAVRAEYALEYGTAAIEMHRDAVKAGQRVLVVDDLLATGGTALATARLVEMLGGRVVGFRFVLELGFLGGREALSGYEIQALIAC